MKSHLRLPDGSRILIRVDLDGVATIPLCPACKASQARIAGSGISHHDHDRYYADGRCMSCMSTIGVIETARDTIFGIEEDSAVLEGRARVY